MSTQPLSEDTRNTLELFVERTEALAQFASANPFGGRIVGLFRDVDEQEWQIHSAINGALCILRSFLQSQDGITLFSVEETSPPRAEGRGLHFLQTLIEIGPGYM